MGLVSRWRAVIVYRADGLIGYNAAGDDVGGVIPGAADRDVSADDLSERIADVGDIWKECLASDGPSLPYW